MHAFDVLGDPARRRIIELLGEGELTSGGIVELIGAEFGITQSAVSQHLAVLRSSGFAVVRRDGARRIYALEPGPLSEIDRWMDRFRHLWGQKLDALHTEIVRGRRARRDADEESS